MYYTWTKLYYDINLGAIGINITWHDVPIVLALNQIAALIGIFFRNAWRCLCFGCLSSVVWSFTKMYKRNFKISWNFYKEGINYELNYKINYKLKTELAAHKFATFWNFRNVFITNSLRKWPHTLYNRLNASRLARLRKTRKHVNHGKTQCWALFVISKATFTKTAIKPKFGDTFPWKNFSAAIDQFTIKSPNFVSVTLIPQGIFCKLTMYLKKKTYISAVIHISI